MRIPLQRSDSPSAPSPVHGAHAVVLGASISGLLAARVLSDHFDQVTVVERDLLPATAEPRRGVPQGRHVHVLLPRGASALEELFEGFLDELAADGAASPRNLSQYYLDFGGYLLNQDDMDGDPAYLQSRPFLERHVSDRVQALPNVTVLDGHDVAGLRWDSEGRRVVGVSAVPRHRPEAGREIPADLVVAATGRSGRVGSWLSEREYEPPAEDELRIDLVYASRWMRLDRSLTEGWDVVVVSPNPDRPIGVTALAQENDMWVVSLEGFSGHHPSTDPKAWLETATSLAPPGFAAAIREGEAITDISAHRIPSNLWRRYDKLGRFPEGLLVTGDAICSFNPIYGQGMMVAALEALALRDTLRTGEDNLANRYFKQASKPVRLAWQTAVGADLSMPAEVVAGPRPLPLRAVNAYMELYQEAAQHDPVLAMQFLKVTGFEEPARALFSPSAVRRIVGQRRRRTRERATQQGR